jgi:hypothetical protein
MQFTSDGYRYAVTTKDTERRGVGTGVISASEMRGLGFYSRPGDQLPWQRCFPLSAIFSKQPENKKAL